MFPKHNNFVIILKFPPKSGQLIRATHNFLNFKKKWWIVFGDGNFKMFNMAHLMLKHIIGHIIGSDSESEVIFIQLNLNLQFQTII